MMPTRKPAPARARRVHPMMKPADAAAFKELLKIPGVGPATAGDLLRLGIRRLSDLAGKNGEDLYTRLCSLDGVRHDPCLLDVFRAVVSIADGNLPRPWWEFSKMRKAGRFLNP